MTVVYIHPKANVVRAAQHICNVTQKLDALSTDAPKFILGDFNQCKLENCLPTYHQYITCLTRMNKTINLCYGSVPNAYRSINARRLLVHKSPLSIARYSFIQLSEQEQCRVNKLSQGVNTAAQDSNPGSRSRESEALPLSHCALHCIVLYCIVLYCIVLYCIVLYCIVLYCIVLHCIVLYCIVRRLCNQGCRTICYG